MNQRQTMTAFTAHLPAYGNSPGQSVLPLREAEKLGRGEANKLPLVFSKIKIPKNNALSLKLKAKINFSGGNCHLFQWVLSKIQ